MLQQVPDDLVTDRGHPDPLSLARQGYDHGRTRVRLSRPGRALDGQDPAIETARKAHRGIHDVLAFPAERALHRFLQPRLVLQQEVPGCTEGPVVVHAAARRGKGELEKGAVDRPRRHPFVHHHRERVRGDGAPPLDHVECSRSARSRLATFPMTPPPIS